MPQSLKDLRQRIKSVKNTQQITKAMKLVAASKFGRAQNAVLQSRPYAKALTQMASSLVKYAGDKVQHGLLTSPQSNDVLVIVISSERGLCGGYNSNVTKAAIRTIESLEAEGKRTTVVSIGKKAYQILSRKRASLGAPQFITQAEYQLNPEVLMASRTSLITTSFEKPTFELATNLSEALTKLFEAGRFGKVVVVYNKFQSAMTQIPTTEQVLPISSEGGDTQDASGGAMIFEPDFGSLIDAVLPRYLATRLFQLGLEAVASEHGARMSAMDSATRNAKDMLRKIEITYQRARQAAITSQLIEIISGAEAL